MTYCAAWTYEGGVFFIADTLATIPGGTAGSTHTSMGQLQGEVRGEQVDERLLKLVPLGGGIVGAFAGPVELATECLKFLRSQFVQDASLSLESALLSMQRNLGPFDPSREVALLLGKSERGGGSELLRWKSSEGVHPSRPVFCDIGSLRTYHANLAYRIVDYLVQRRLSRERMLQVAVPMVLSFGVYDDLTQFNVGGFITGLQTLEGATTWLPDFSAALYDPGNLTAIEVICSVVRDNTLCIGSSLTKDVRLLANSASLPPNLDFTALRSEMVDAVRSGKSVAWAFINTRDRAVTVVFRSNVEASGKLMTLDIGGDSWFRLGLHPELQRVLVAPLVDRRDGGIPLRLNVLND